MFPVLEGGVGGSGVTAEAMFAGDELGEGARADPVGAAVGTAGLSPAAAFAGLPAPPHPTTPLAAENARSAARPSRSIGTARTLPVEVGARSQKGHRASDPPT